MVMRAAVIANEVVASPWGEGGNLISYLRVCIVQLSTSCTHVSRGLQIGFVRILARGAFGSMIACITAT